MNLYIIRHGLAGEHGSYANDDERPLTEEGQRKTKKIAKRLEDFEIRFDLILTSPLVRARQTAEILQAVGLGKTLEESVHLAPGGSFDEWLGWLDLWQRSPSSTSDFKSLAIVGHEPDLSSWAERLLWGRSDQRLVLKKAGVIGLDLPDASSPVGNSQLFWLTPPKFLL
jgi:phosphohistidine phosphatase